MTNKFGVAKHFQVLNYNKHSICITVAPGKTYLIEAAEGDIPTTLPVTWDEIVYANNTPVFKTGILEFTPDLEAEIYEELGINPEDVLKYNEIKDILISPTKEGLTKILKIQTLSGFDRVREIFQKLRYDGYSLTMDVNDLIQERTNELFRGISKSRMLVQENKKHAENAEVTALKAQIAEMQKMQEQLIQLVSQQNTNNVDETDVEEGSSKTEKKVAETQKTTPKKVSRPKINKEK